MMDNALNVNPGLVVFPVSAYSGEGLPAWYQWLLTRREQATELSAEERSGPGVSPGSGAPGSNYSWLRRFG